jgi:formylglycine-generating enzyme required for sulfatase activity
MNKLEAEATPVSRGGPWYDFVRSCRSAHRNYDAPGDQCSYLGFRLVRKI